MSRWRWTEACPGSRRWSPSESAAARRVGGWLSGVVWAATCACAARMRRPRLPIFCKTGSAAVPTLAVCRRKVEEQLEKDQPGRQHLSGFYATPVYYPVGNARYTGLPNRKIVLVSQARFDKGQCKRGWAGTGWEGGCISPHDSFGHPWSYVRRPLCDMPVVVLLLRRQRRWGSAA